MSISVQTGSSSMALHGNTPFVDWEGVSTAYRRTPKYFAKLFIEGAPKMIFRLPVQALSKDAALKNI